MDAPAPPLDAAPSAEGLERFLNFDAPKFYPLTHFAWRKDGSSSMAALMVLIALSIRLNQSLLDEKFDPGKPRRTKVPVTYSELQRMTGFARGAVSSALDILEGVGAIKREKIGRANVYELVGLNDRGEWCQLPQSRLLAPDGALTIKAMERKRATLHALKIYMTLLNLRRQHFNTASVSWAGLSKWTGIRRADVGRALGVLLAWELISISEELDARHVEGMDRSRRYRIEGLSKILHASEVA